MTYQVYPDKTALARAFAAYLAELVAESEQLTVALSGGSTPKVIFDELSAHYADRINWNKLHFYWGDERCVPPDHKESNYKMTVDHLFEHVPVPRANIHRIAGESEPQKAAAEYDSVLRTNLPEADKVPQFDLVLLGMGEDGHTASVFPHQIALWDSDSNCEVAVHPDSGQQRVTLTGKVINNAKRVVFLVTGSGKAEKLRVILGKEEGYLDYPASLVAPTSGALVWFLDAEAASELPDQ